MDRLTPRQAVVIIARQPGDSRLASLAHDLGPERLDALLLAALRDAIAAAVGVDGATIAVVAPSPGALAYLRQVLPAGLELAAPPEPLSVGAASRFAFAHHQDRGFERIVLIDGAVLRLTSRVVGTGLAALAGADIVTGGYRQGSNYAFGLSSRHLPAIVTSDLSLADTHRPGSDLHGRLRGLRLRSRRLDPLPTLDAFATLDELGAAMAGRSGLGRHIAGFLGAAGWSSTPGIEHGRPLLS